MAGKSSQGCDAASMVVLQTILFLLSLAVFLAAPVIDVSDSRYAVLLSESFWRHHTAALDEYYKVPVPWPRDTHPDGPNEYQLVKARGHVTYFFPHGSSMLSMPLVAAINAAGVSAATPGGRLDLAGEIRIERVIASVLMAGLTCLFFATAMMMLPVSWSVVVALGASMGSQILSTASRGLWSHDWEVFLCGLIAYSLLSTEHRGSRFRPVWLGTLVAWIYFVRPTGSVTIVAVSTYVMWIHREDFIAYAATLTAWLAAFVGYWWSVFGVILSQYFVAARMRFENLAVGMAGNLISPSRGLFVFVPTTLFVLYLAARYRKHLTHKPLALLALAQIVGLAIIISNFFGSQGYCYGPRYFTDAIPWFVLLAILGLDAMRYAQDASNHRMEIAAAIFLLAVSVAMNARGAWSWAATDWTVSDYAAAHQTKIFDWRYPPFMAGLITPPSD